MCVILLSVIVDIIVITTILLCSLSLKPWLYPFLFYLQVNKSLYAYICCKFNCMQYYVHTYMDIYRNNNILQVTPYFAQYFPVTFSAVQPYVRVYNYKCEKCE